MENNLNPFTKLYDTIVKTFKDGGLKVLDWNSSRDPETELPTENELPEYQLRPVGMTGRIGSSSCGTQITRTYQVLINSGDKRVGVLFAEEWRLLKVLNNLKYGTALDSIPQVFDVNISSYQVGLSNSLENRGIEGWTAIWAISVDMQFSGEELT